jgi:alpha-glucosidase
MDTPEQTLALPEYAVNFLKEIPVTWDDTRYVAGYPGKDVVIARKKGETWYIAGINGENKAKDLAIDLSVTGEAPASIQVITDGSTARDLQMAELTPEEGKLTLHLEPYGGFAGTW